MQHIILNILAPFRVYSLLAPINHVTTCTLHSQIPFSSRSSLSFFSSRAIDDDDYGGGGGITISSTSTVILASLSLLSFRPNSRFD